MPDASRTCAECGARLTPGAERCDLCGHAVAGHPPVDEPQTEGRVDSTPLKAPDPPPTTDAAEPSEAAALQENAPSAAEPGVFCNQCGWRNPPGARFCSMCGGGLQDLAAPAAPPAPASVESGVAPDAPRTRTARPAPPPSASKEAASPDEKDEHRAVTKQVGIIVGAGVLLVVVLFLVTAVSKDLTTGGAPAVGEAETATTPVAPSTAAPTPPPLTPELEEQVAVLEDEAAQLTGTARVEKQLELVSILFGAGRLDRAALAQQEIAQASGNLDDWKRTGDLFYDWMMTVEGDAKVQAAQQAIEAYQRVLAEDPDNLDVRTDMATAYLSSNNPMQGVQEINQVLEADSTHLQARFNYGIMLAMIGRTDKALDQFERVKTQVGEESPLFQQAEDAIQSIQGAGARP